MSLRGRYIIDRMKRAVGRYIKFPVPPYGDFGYWEDVYSRLSPDEVHEFGRFSADDLLTYQCRSRTLVLPDVLLTGVANNRQRQQQPDHWLPDPQSPQLQMTLRDMLGLPSPSLTSTPPSPPNSNEAEKKKQEEQEEPILVLGCGNSRFGEQLLVDNPQQHDTGGGRRCRGPILHVDISSRVIHDMSLRNKHRSNDLIYVQDDAAVLSSLSNQAVLAVVDKGTIDAIFCTDDYETCWNIVMSAHRVLRHGGVFCCFSFSRPEFLLSKILLPSSSSSSSSSSFHNSNDPKHWRRLEQMWEYIQVQQLDFIYLYRFVKTTPRPIHVSQTSRRQQQQQQ
jgi:SAM-dependent methyltransferase